MFIGLFMVFDAHDRITCSRGGDRVKWARQASAKGAYVLVVPRRSARGSPGNTFRRVLFNATLMRSVRLTWETAKGDLMETEAKCGMNLMRVAHAHGIELEGEPAAPDQRATAVVNRKRLPRGNPGPV